MKDSRHLNAMTTADLLSAIIGTQQTGEAILDHFGSLQRLASADTKEIQRIPNIGPKKAATIKAAFQLTERLQQELQGESPLLDTPDHVADLLRDRNRAYQVERFQVVLLNTRKRLIRVTEVAAGTLDTVLTHPREIFRTAILENAASIILAHNHPSGDPSPSQADIRVTRDLIRAGELIKIDVVDHIILGTRTQERPRDFCSLRELGYFYR